MSGIESIEPMSRIESPLSRPSASERKKFMSVDFQTPASSRRTLAASLTFGSIGKN